MIDIEFGTVEVRKNMSSILRNALKAKNYSQIEFEKIMA